MEIDADKIEGYRKRMRKTKEEKIEAVTEGREEAQRNRKPENKSKTNDEKKKNKPFAMTRYRNLYKQKLKGSQKKLNFTKHLEKRSNQKVNKHRKWHKKSKA